jgi:glucan phosphoethanolaminetransferase (alkaline phosphatase superfamily)
MNVAHVHLILNHAPLFGVIAGIVLLAWGTVRSSHEVRLAAYTAFIVSALAAIVVYFTGGPAESLIENLPGISEKAIERHEEIAKIALGLTWVSGIFAAIAFFAERSMLRLRKPVLATLFALALVTVGVVGYTANLGGQIRHSEITAHQ